ncbi:MAG: hypothetical protein HQ519_04060 [Planctomycetes bacterium]|nr:hypothetical protein [Planctomycetota bacterium]
MYPFIPLDGILSVELFIALASSALICIFAQERKGAGLAMSLLLFVPLAHLTFTSIDGQLFLWLWFDFDEGPTDLGISTADRAQYLGEIASCLLLQPLMFLLVHWRAGTQVSARWFLAGLAGLGVLFSVFAIAEELFFREIESSHGNADGDGLEWVARLYPVIKQTTIFIGAAAIFGAFCALAFSKQHRQRNRAVGE